MEVFYLGVSTVRLFHHAFIQEFLSICKNFSRVGISVVCVASFVSYFPINEFPHLAKRKCLTTCCKHFPKIFNLMVMVGNDLLLKINQMVSRL